MKGSLDPGDAYRLITDHASGTPPVQKMLRLKYGNKWKKSKSADKRIVDYIVNIVRPLAKTVSTKGDPFYEFFDKSDGAIEAIANRCKVHSFNPLWIEGTPRSSG